jgi:hypothetical protein
VILPYFLPFLLFGKQKNSGQKKIILKSVFFFGRKVSFSASDGAIGSSRSLTASYLFDETFNESNSLQFTKLKTNNCETLFRIAVAHYRASKNLV